MIDVEKLKLEVVGKWRGLYEALGIDVPDDPKKHAACPICGPGNNGHRFRFDDKDGRGGWICTHCGAGDGWSMVQRKFGKNHWEAIVMVSSIVGTVEQETPKQENDKDYRQYLTDLWTKAKPLTGSDPASCYLHSRGISISPLNIRYSEKCWCSETKRDMEAMIAKIFDKDNKPIGIHRTYMDGPNKAELEEPRKQLNTVKKPGALRIAAYKDVLGIAEGIETALSAQQLFDIPTWSVLNATQMELFEPPDDVRKFVIYGDNDRNFKGQSAAYKLANKLYLRDLIVDVQIPESFGDWNDVLKFNQKAV